MIRETDTSHYFDEEPSTPSRPRMVTLELPDMAMELVTDAGVFGAQRVDPGTRTLLDSDLAGKLCETQCCVGFEAPVLR